MLSNKVVSLHVAQQQLQLTAVHLGCTNQACSPAGTPIACKLMNSIHTSALCWIRRGAVRPVDVLTACTAILGFTGPVTLGTHAGLLILPEPSVRCRCIAAACMVPIRV